MFTYAELSTREKGLRRNDRKIELLVWTNVLML